VEFGVGGRSLLDHGVIVIGHEVELDLRIEATAWRVRDDPVIE
jgi:hypothetical protein